MSTTNGELPMSEQEYKAEIVIIAIAIGALANTLDAMGEEQILRTRFANLANKPPSDGTEQPEHLERMKAMAGFILRAYDGYKG